MRTLRAWDIRIDESLFLGGLSKGEFLQAFDADVLMTSRATVNLPVITSQPGMFRMVSPIRSSPHADFLRSCLLDSHVKGMCGPIAISECASVSMFHADTGHVPREKYSIN